MITSKNSIIRLSKYRNVLYRLRSMAFIKVFSDNLADAVGVTSSQVRKDFSLFGITGNKKGGYIIEELINKLNQILGKDTIQKVIIVGVGNIGRALIAYRGFEKEGIKITAAFDIDTAKQCDNGQEIPIYPLEKIREYIRDNEIKIGIIAVPDIAAPQVFDFMVSAGIKGILNFASIRLKGIEDCVINNVNIEHELENVIYFVNALKNTKNVYENENT